MRSNLDLLQLIKHGSAVVFAVMNIRDCSCDRGFVSMTRHEHGVPSFKASIVYILDGCGSKTVWFVNFAGAWLFSNVVHKALNLTLFDWFIGEPDCFLLVVRKCIFITVVKETCSSFLPKIVWEFQQGTFCIIRANTCACLMYFHDFGHHLGNFLV